VKASAFEPHFLYFHDTRTAAVPGAAVWDILPAFGQSAAVVSIMKAFPFQGIPLPGKCLSFVLSFQYLPLFDTTPRSGRRTRP